MLGASELSVVWADLGVRLGRLRTLEPHKVTFRRKHSDLTGATLSHQSSFMRATRAAVP